VPREEFPNVLKELFHQAKVTLQVQGASQLFFLRIQLVEPLLEPVLVPPPELAQARQVQQELVQRHLNQPIRQHPPKLAVLLKQGVHLVIVHVPKGIDQILIGDRRVIIEIDRFEVLAAVTTQLQVLSLLSHEIYLCAISIKNRLHILLSDLFSLRNCNFSFV